MKKLVAFLLVLLLAVSAEARSSSGGSRSGGGFSGGSRSYSAPSRSYSAPSRSFSAPSAPSRPSGGSFSGASKPSSGSGGTLSATKPSAPSKPSTGWFSSGKPSGGSLGDGAASAALNRSSGAGAFKASVKPPVAPTSVNPNTYRATTSRVYRDVYVQPSAPRFGNYYHPSFGSYMMSNGPSWGDFLLWNMVFSMNSSDRAQFDELNKDNAELKAKLDALNAKFTAEGKAPDPNYWPSDLPKEAALSEDAVKEAAKLKEEEDSNVLLIGLVSAGLAIVAGIIIYAAVRD